MRRTSLLAIALTVTTILGLPGPSAAQEANKAGQTSSSAKPKKAPQGQPDEGTIVNGLYEENFFLLHYTIPQGWVVKTPEMRKDLPGQESAWLLLSAFAKSAPSAGEVNSSVNISAENVGASQAKTADDYLQGIAEFATSKGFTVLNPPGEITFGGVNFVREDFQKQEGDVTTYQATMVTLRRGYFLQITVITGNEEQLTPLLNRMQITAPPTLKRP